MNGQQRKEDGIQSVLIHNLDWMIEVYKAFLTIKNSLLTIEDVRLACYKQDVPEPEHPNAWGGVINALATQGLIKPTPMYVRSSKPSSHSRKIQVWEKCHGKNVSNGR